MRLCPLNGARACRNNAPSPVNELILETTSCWSADLTGVDVAPFVQPVGPAVNLPATLVGIFRLFFTTTLIASIVEETNRYAREVLGDAATTKWVDVVAEDVWAFLGFTLLMGINRLPQPPSVVEQTPTRSTITYSSPSHNCPKFCGHVVTPHKNFYTRAGYRSNTREELYKVV